ncbi:MAG: TonB-dependent receptor [Candidatus Kapaibacteriota bacterium]
MIRTFLPLLFITSTFSSSAFAIEPEPADMASISGYVVDGESKEPLIRVMVTVKDTKIGAYTNKQGFFTLRSIKPGKITVKVSGVGYTTMLQEYTLSEGEQKKVNIRLKKGDVLTDQVKVEADREVEKREISISRVNIPMEQLTQLRIGGEADVFRALQFLPGVLTSSQISSGLYVRGGSPDQNLVLLDGSTVYNPSHLFGFISAFNPDAIKDVELIKGGYPAEYGSRLSAVLNLTQKDGNRDEYEGIASLGLISSRGSFQGPIGNGAFFLGGRRTYLDLLLGALPEDPNEPLPNFNFYDLNAKVTQDLGENDKIFLSGFMSADKLILDAPGIDFEVGIGNRNGAFRWTHIFGDNLFTSVNLSGSRYVNGFTGNNGGFSFKIENTIIDYTLRADLEWFASDDLTIKTGYEGTSYTFGYMQNFTGNADTVAQSGTVSEGGLTNFTIGDYTHAYYVQSNYQFSDLVSLQTGFRFNYWDSSDVFTIDPRFALRYQLQEDIVLKASWGMFHQYLRLATQPDFTFFDTWLPTDNTVPASKATHYIFSVETKPFEGYDMNFDFYYKDLRNISELRVNNTQGRTVSDVFFTGDGEAYGAEFFLQKKMGAFTGWIGYGLGYVFGQFDSVNQGRVFRPKYDRRHDIKLVGLYKLNQDWEFGATFTFQSGQSYTGATSRFATRKPGETIDSPQIVPGDRYGLRLPNTHQLNFNVNYNTTIWGLPARVMIDIFNVYSRRDIWFRFYDTSKDVTEVTDVRLLPILPTVALEVKF